MREDDGRPCPKGTPAGTRVVQAHPANSDRARLPMIHVFPPVCVPICVITMSAGTCRVCHPVLATRVIRRRILYAKVDRIVEPPEG